ncbi:Rieske 2Fe-2S domain-containing protein [Terriglobus sp. 2YAB30_2]|uniref:Rieske 2Fe-2S domain-containing protein n=1 Tax=Terriglobus sp. 2YAB30_2 TaxID=3233023 RepID=UPI003F9CD8AF
MKLRNDSLLANVEGPPTELIFGDWYPALRSDLLRKGKTTTSLLLGVPLLLGRKNDGRIFAMRDLCPHRGIPLSAGWFDGEHVQCKYHGWKFEPCGGQCAEIPSLTQFDTLQPGKIFAGAYPCVEQDGYAWVYVPKPGENRVPASLPPVPELPKFGPRFTTAHLQADLPCNVDHGIIGLMDPAHGPFVHRAWWWRSAASIHEKTKHFEPIADGFRMSPHTPSSNSAPYKLIGKPETTIDFSLPNRRFETVVARKNGEITHWFASLTTVTPVTASTCRIDVIAAWSMLTWLPIVRPIAMWFGKRFVRQDQETMMEQAEGLRFRPAMMLIDDADKPAKWYFALKQRRLSGEGEHPLPGPVELHWRS